MFFNQPLAVRFGTELLRHIDQTDRIEPFWDSLDIAVAWVRASGMAHLSERLGYFLRNGGEMSVIVGIDLQNTTKDGLQALLDLEQHGRCETFIYHNEAGSIFHPKLYLFRNEEEARLIVGSNNITESGLYVNVEAGLQVDTQLDAPVVTQALDAISSWKDLTTNLTKRLNPDVLEQLAREGYVPDEAVSRETMRETQTRRSGRERRLIFGSRRFSPPAKPGVAKRRTASATAHTVAAMAPATGNVLLMRLRKASITGRPTQTQIPFRVVETFFRGATTVRSAHSGQAHGIVKASARGGRNTIKLEIPEMRNFNEPVARFDRTPDGIVYEAYDVGSPKGNQIMASLQEGRRNGTTQMSISTPASATWWRSI